MNISIIIPIYNEEKHLDKFLESLRQINYPKHKLQITIVDDGSSDNSAIIVEDFIKSNKALNIKFLKNSENKGHLYTRNLAISNAVHDYVVCLDAHQILDKDLVYEFVEIHRKTKDDVIMGNILLESNSKIPKLNEIILKRIYGKNYISKDFDDYYIDSNNFDQSPKGAAILFIKKSLYLEAEPNGISKNTSDDVKLFKNIVKIKGEFIRTSKAFSYYIGREKLSEELKHIYSRGPKFVDYYFKSGTRYFYLLLLLLTSTILMPFVFIILVYLLGIALFLKLFGLFLIIILIFPIFIFAQKLSDVPTLLLFPFFLFAFVLGIYRGITLKLFIFFDSLKHGK